ncbi:MAG TPA: hypothetical protein VMW08_10805 [Acidimicrobiales bacterium]|nr:hypothetical protein [Acidimicrobiales bacterium]
MFDDLGSTPSAVGRELADVHQRGGAAGPSLHEYVERLHPGGWSMRAALVRYGQPEPRRAAELLELTRRAESGYHEHARRIEREPRLSDLARALEAFGHDYPALLDAYLLEGDPLDDEATSTVPVLAVAAALDDVGALVASWAVEAGADRPDDEIDRVCTRAAAQLDALGVERQEWYR